MTPSEVMQLKAAISKVRVAVVETGCRGGHFGIETETGGGEHFSVG